MKTSKRGVVALKMKRTVLFDEVVTMSQKTYKCETCHDTGWYGDLGPGKKGNYEYVPCDQCVQAQKVETCPACKGRGYVLAEEKQ
jgi:uncharacterized protein with PIN domain